VAVGTQEHEVLEPVVEAVPVHVMERERERFITPTGDATYLAADLLEARPE
jgi:hypothetical protein